MKYKLLITTLILGVVFSCTDIKNNGIFYVNLVNPEKKNINLSDLCDSISYITLGNNYLMKHLNKIQLKDSAFVLSTYPEGILIYNIKGKFIRKIGSIGRGPGEYNNGINFTINNNKNIIYVDNDNGSILKFNYNGQYLGKVRLNTIPTPGFIDYMDNCFILSYPIITSTIKQPFQWTVVDTNMNIIYKKLNHYKFSSDNPSYAGQLTYKFNNCVYYWNHYNDTIFQIEHDKYQPGYILLKDKYRLTTDIVSKFRNFGDVKDYILIRRIGESDNYLFVIFDLHNETKLLMFDKKEKRTYKVNNLKVFGFNNDIDGGLSFVPDIIVNNNIAVMSIDAYRLKSYIASGSFKNSTPKYPEKKKQLEKLANSLDENDNPVLMLVKLKE